MQTLLQYLANLANDPAAQQKFAQDPDAAIAATDLGEHDKAVLRTRNAGLIHATVGQQALASLVYAPALVYNAAPPPPPPLVYGAHPALVYGQAPPPPLVYGQAPPPPLVYGAHPALVYGAAPPAPLVYAVLVYGAQHPALVYGAQPPALVYGAQPPAPPAAPALVYATKPEPVK